MWRGYSVAGVVLGMSILGIAAAQTASRTPNPPTKVCIGSKCATTAASPAGGRIKWNPGHYGASGGYANIDSSFSKFRPEMDEMLRDDWIVGYRLLITWSALDAGPAHFTGAVGGATRGTLTAIVETGTYWAAFSDGEYRDVSVSGTAVTWSGALQSGADSSVHLYTTGVLDQILGRLKTAYNKPKQLVIAIVPMSWAGGSHRAGDYSRVPQYIMTDSTYGPSPDPGSYGWWGPPVGTPTGAYTAALYRPAVAAQYAKLGAALGARYDSDPNFEAIMDQETSALVMPALNYAPRDPSYSDAAYLAQMQMFLSAWLAAFPHTNVVSENTFMNTSTVTQQFEAWMIAHRVAPGTADVSGQSYYDLGKNLSNWGLQAYAGQTARGSAYKGQDFRGIARPMLDVEGPDIGTGSGLTVSAAPLDMVLALNQTYKASHAFWCHDPGGHKPVPKWAQVTAVLKDHPLTNTGYPGNYP